MTAEDLGENLSHVRIKVIIVTTVLTAIRGHKTCTKHGGTIAFAYDRASWISWPFLMILVGGLANNSEILIRTLIFVTLQKSIIFFRFIERICPIRCNLAWFFPIRSYYNCNTIVFTIRNICRKTNANNTKQIQIKPE